MRVWRWLAAVAVWMAVWLLGVAVVAAVAWFAIDSAGREVAGSDDVLSLVSAPQASPAQPSRAQPSRAQPSRAQSSRAQPSPAQPSPDVATTSRSVVPTPMSPSSTLRAARPAPGTQPPTESGTQLAARPPTPSARGSGGGRTSSYSTAGGDLVVRCVDDRVTSWAMRPADGWRGEAAPATEDHLKVLFVAGDGRTFGVQVACRDSQGVFSPTPASPWR